jgi:hypothetical protein
VPEGDLFGVGWWGGRGRLRQAGHWTGSSVRLGSGAGSDPVPGPSRELPVCAGSKAVYITPACMHASGRCLGYVIEP